MTPPTSRPRRTDLARYLEETVYPALFERLTTACPEFGFRAVGGGYEATAWPADFPLRVEHPRPDRLQVYQNTPFGVFVHGHHHVRWLDYINGGRKPSGPEFVPAVTRLCELAGVPFPDQETTAEELEQSRRWEERRSILAAVLERCREELWGEAGAEARAYMRFRGFTDADLRDLQLGLYPPTEDMREYLASIGCDLGAAQENCLLWGRLTGYIVLPWNDPAGSPLTLYGRWASSSLPRMIDLPAWRRRRDEALAQWERTPVETQAASPWEEPLIPKTIALPGERTKGAPLFFDRARRAGHHQDLVAVEGVFDAALLQCRGDHRVVAYVAAQFSGEQVETLARYGVKRVIICPDPDGGGNKGARSSSKALRKRGIAAYVATRLPDGLDPDEFLLRDGIDAWRAHVSDPTPGAVHEALCLLDGMTRKAPEFDRRAKAETLAEFAREIVDDLDREAVIRLAADRTGIGARAFRKLMGPSNSQVHANGDGRRNGTAHSPSTNGAGHGEPPAQGRPPDASAADPRPAVEITTRRHEVVEETIRALGADPDLYFRGEALVGASVDDDEDVKLTPRTVLSQVRGAPRIQMLAEPIIGCVLTRNASFYTWRSTGSETKPVDSHPPTWLIQAVAQRKRWPGVRPLLMIVEAPFPRPDGSIVENRGYDAATGALYLPSCTFPAVPKNPKQADAQAAWDRLGDVIREFPFASDEDRVVWLAALLGMIARPSIDGPVPGVAVNANVAGSGKGLLIDIKSLIVHGRVAPTSAYPVDPEEADKVKLAIAISGRPVIHFDNLPEGGGYGNSALDSALTSSSVNGRILGSSRETGDLPLRVSWFLSGNNVYPIKDAYRRWLVSNLVSELEHPERRDDIQVKDLRSHVLARRPELVQAALIILRAHALAGRPTDNWAPLGSYEVWDPIIRGAVWFATGMDCCATQQRIADDSDDRRKKLALLEGWRELPDGKDGATGVTAARAIEIAGAADGQCPALVAALLDFGKDGRLATSGQLGHKLRGLKNHVIDGLKLVEAGRQHQALLWKVVRVGTRRSGGGWEDREVYGHPANNEGDKKYISPTVFENKNDTSRISTGCETASPTSHPPLAQPWTRDPLACWLAGYLDAEPIGTVAALRAARDFAVIDGPISLAALTQAASLLGVVAAGGMCSLSVPPPTGDLTDAERAEVEALRERGRAARVERPF